MTEDQVVTHTTVEERSGPSEGLGKERGQLVRIPQLDGLRGAAILGVLLSHVSGEVFVPVTALPGAAAAILGGLAGSGLDCFFVLSGFLIGGILLGTKTSPTYFRTFYIRRAYRVLPIYYLWLTVYLTIRFVHLHSFGAFAPDYHAKFPFPIYFVFLQNWFFAFRWTARAYGFTWHFLGPTWSLAVEEQFYLLAPLLIYYLRKKTLVVVLSFIVAIDPLIRYVVIHLSSIGYDIAFSNTICRLDLLSLGVLIAVLSSEERWRAQLRLHVSKFYPVVTTLILVATGSQLLLLGPYSTVNATLVRSTWALIYGCVIVVLVHDPTSRVAGVLKFTPLRQLAKISYAIYLIHLGVMFSCHRLLLHRDPRITDWQGLLVTLFGLLLTIALAGFSWTFFESPLVKQGHLHKY